MVMRLTLLPPLAAMVLISGCGSGGDSGTFSTRSWQAPDDYEFTVESSCGERSLIGEFRVIVEDGSVVQAEGLDESGRAFFKHGADDDVPTLSELLDEAATAEEEGADVVEVQVTAEGLPREIKIDWETNATDDEACYEISGYSAAN